MHVIIEKPSTRQSAKLFTGTVSGNVFVVTHQGHAINLSNGEFYSNPHGLSMTALPIGTKITIEVTE